MTRLFSIFFLYKYAYWCQHHQGCPHFPSGIALLLPSQTTIVSLFIFVFLFVHHIIYMSYLAYGFVQLEMFAICHFVLNKDYTKKNKK